jgi:hypothetical protein
MGGHFEHGNELLGSVNCLEIGGFSRNAAVS